MGLIERLLNRARAIGDERPPDVVIATTDGKPYLSRWWVIPRNKYFNIYLHHFQHSDDDRALHDHPWVNISILLEGSYKEVTPKGEFRRRQGHWYCRRPSQAHRVELYPSWFVHYPPDDSRSEALIPVWTLFITGPVVREWGFLCPRGWVPWRKFVGHKDDAVRRGVLPPASVGCGE